MQGRARLLRLPLLVAGVGVALVLSRHWPSDQSVHVVLGDAAPQVEEVRLRYGELAGGHDDWQREVEFHYATGHAPRIVSHEPRLVSGDYDVEIEITRAAAANEARVLTLARRVTLDGHTTSVDVSAAAKAAP
jgi:hypothetical protein